MRAVIKTACEKILCAGDVASGACCQQSAHIKCSSAAWENDLSCFDTVVFGYLNLLEPEIIRLFL